MSRLLTLTLEEEFFEDIVDTLGELADDSEEAGYAFRAQNGMAMKEKLREAIVKQRAATKQTTTVALGSDNRGHLMSILLPKSETAIIVDADWWGVAQKMLQVIVTPADSDDNAVYVRFCEDGAIHSIVVDDEHWLRVKREQEHADDWVTARDTKKV